MSIEKFKGALNISEVVEILKNASCDIVITGRNSPHEIIQLADIATDMVSIKHHYSYGIPAKKGIDY